MTWTIKAENGETRSVESRAEAKSVKADMEKLGINCEIIPPNTKADGGEAVMQTQETQEDSMKTEEPDIEEPDIDKNPVEWLPDHLIDIVEGVPTISRKGYCIVCQQYGVSIESEAVVRSSSAEFEYAEFRAVAVDADGKKFTGFGTAHIERGDDPYLLNELAETRAMKRAATWATGVGLTAVEEME